jgi:signal transduction histidine kinase/CheY-like chemotaxis protein
LLESIHCLYTCLKFPHHFTIESIRAPLGKEYQSIYAVFAAAGAASLCIFGLFWFSTRLRTEVAIKTENLEEELSARIEVENELRIQATMLEEEIAERQKTQEALHHAKETAEAANKAKSLFLANMSHELRTPLNGVVGMAQLLSMSEISEEQKDYLDTLQYSADNLIALISDILDITKIEAERFEIHHDQYSLRSCIDEVVMMQRAKIHEKNLQVEKFIPDNIPDTLTGDRIRILQILSNLLSNAIKFTDCGNIKISIAVKEQHGSTILLDIAVADTGIGFAPDMLGYIFSMFTQADESNTRRHGGAGLGLAISRRLAELMGGSIAVESKVGVGSTFHLILPCSTVPSQPNGLDTSSSESIEATTRSLSVLLAEDNPANSVYAQKLLTKLGHTVVLAVDGEKALQEWEQGNFDLILMDIQMPKMNGDEVVKIIREREDNKHTPIIAVTAHAIMGDQKRLLEAGCDGYVSKPFTVETLVAEIKRVVTG